MTLEQAKKLVAECIEQMNARYKKPVFDEWAIISFRDGRGLLCSYVGPRKEGFQANFLQDAGPLRAGLLAGNHQAGHFEFSRQSVGTGFESFMAFSENTYLICNNTVQSMDEIARDPLWLGAQEPFADLSEALRQDPVETVA